MRWKLKDLLAESVHPVPEKVVLADFRHAKTTRSGTSGKNKTKPTAKKKLQQNQLKCSSKTETVKEKMNIVTLRWFTEEAGTRDSGFCNYWKTCPTTNVLSWLMVCLMMSHFPLILIVSRFTNRGCSDVLPWIDHNFNAPLENKETNQSVALNGDIVQIQPKCLDFRLRQR